MTNWLAAKNCWLLKVYPNCTVCFGTKTIQFQDMPNLQYFSCSTLCRGNFWFLIVPTVRQKFWSYGYHDQETDGPTEIKSIFFFLLQNMYLLCKSLLLCSHSRKNKNHKQKGIRKKCVLYFHDGESQVKLVLFIKINVANQNLSQMPLQSVQLIALIKQNTAEYSQSNLAKSNNYTHKHPHWLSC